MIDFSLNSIINQGVYDTPDVDRDIQKIIIYCFYLIMFDYGFLNYGLSDIVNILDEYIGSNNLNLDFSGNYLLKYIEGFKNYGLDVNINAEIINIEPFIINDIENCDLKFFESLSKIINKKYGLYEPLYFKQLLEDRENRLKELSDLKIEFLCTSRLFEKKEISDKMAEMIKNANDHIYMMLAFYQEDVLFFSDFLITKILNSNIDLKIIYNPNDSKNAEFIKLLYQKFDDEDIDFFRAYGASYLKRYPRKFVGNLHSKAVITESELLVGSANLTAMSLYHNVENALYTTHNKSVKTANDFFRSLWNELRPINAI